MDIEVLEAAAAAASSEGSITAVNAFANGPGNHGIVKLPEGQGTEGLTEEVESSPTDVPSKGSSILSIAHSIAREHVIAPRRKTDHSTGADEQSYDDLEHGNLEYHYLEPGRQEAEDMESIRSFGDDGCRDDTHTEVDGEMTEDKENRAGSKGPVFRLQTGDEKTGGRNSANESDFQDDTPYDSACLFPEEGSHPGFDIYVDSDCR